MNPISYWRDWWRGLGVIEQTVVLVILVAAVVVILISPTAAEPATRVQLFVPIDVVALVQAIFTGIAAVGSVFATIYSLRAADRAKRAELLSASNAAVISKVKDTVDLVERNTNSLTTQIAAASRLAGMHEGEAKGRLAGEDAARTLAEGQKQGAEIERASVAAATITLQPVAIAHAALPVPVVDDRAAAIAERSVAATERIADATEKKKE